MALAQSKIVRIGPAQQKRRPDPTTRATALCIALAKDAGAFIVGSLEGAGKALIA